ncbi:arginine deiminase-related protein [Acinetobacter sp. HY1485]|uniref:arginine deiminase-related protein n=1 Tax=Acinetobacter sp. HY1485 TaxID=2970918 RepID=UPI0022B94556|nr:arginine deiminase-related protein [Acinetobacter sp. HY1485]
MQTAQHILMIRPTNFMVNPQTVSSNHFQNTYLSIQNSQEKAQQEFDYYVNILKKTGVQVTVIEDQKTPITPDALFPNNWLMMLPTGQMVTCPMQAPNRRQERRQDILDFISRQFFC